MARPRTPTMVRFRKYVAQGGIDECWPWQGTKAKGYGQIRDFVNERYVFRNSARVAFEEVKGPIPPGMFVLHTCDNSACVNPKHLFLGTAKDNVLDMVKKGRNCCACGDVHPKAKTRIIKDGNEEHSIAGWAMLSKIRRKVIKDRLNAGWEPHKAIWASVRHWHRIARRGKVMAGSSMSP